ncbi:ABC transporter ATP-binding protein [Agrobacterium vitis]|uniref:ABC transporter ATP-binding protein n=1 Tax=Allorhizobium ampelinum TaxID=3025782 RepID=UPI001F1B417F|nr:ABC transporter ATP-binding protein [Allorhizobium ampelinum]MCF1464811.1 ABC transporter ATP-binding protein [Allorhizobium ampelinum]
MTTSNPSEPQAHVRLGARGITRRFGALTANDGVDFRATAGTIHAIVGGNGAGKSTLMRILQGMDRPDAGHVIVNGEPVRLKGPRDAYALGIGMVHQEFMLVPGLTLLENLILAKEPVTVAGLVDKAAALAAAATLEVQAGVRLDWGMKVDEAPVHVRQILEILRLLYRGADVLILDEPTAVLAPSQIRDLTALLKRLRNEGRTILFISHKLDEVMAVSDDITVMRAGRALCTLATSTTSKQDVAKLMIGELLPSLPARQGQPGDRVLAAEDLMFQDNQGVHRLKSVSLTVRKGEIVAIAGVAGNGQDELSAALTGVITPCEGRIRLCGRDVTSRSLAARRAHGLAYLSPDRAAEGLCLNASIADNAVAGHHRRGAFLRFGILRRRRIARHVEALLDGYSVKRASSRLPVGNLSGGNQQRVAIARELDGDPVCLIACQPTRGVDINGIAFLHKCLLDYRDRGGSVVLISEEMEEIIALADRILVMYNGEIVGELERGSDMETIGRLMLGGHA